MCICRVQYDGCTNRWTFHPAALKKVCTFQVDDIVTIINDAAKVEKWQKGHGEWVETMRNVIIHKFISSLLLSLFVRFHLDCFLFCHRALRTMYDVLISCVFFSLFYC